MDAFDISASAMSAQRLRMDIIASNLANVNTTRKADGTVGPYRRKNVVFAPILEQSMGGGKGFSNSMQMKSSSLMTTQDGPRHVSFDHGVPTLKATIGRGPSEEAAGVKVVGIEEDNQTPMKLVYDPTHPDANADGYVALPNINPVTEMIDMISASRAYEANVNAIQASKSIGKAALEI